MRVRLLLFAALRDIAGAPEIVLDLANGTRVIDVWNELRARHAALAAYVTPPLSAINEDYADPASELHDGDELAFVPPVSGGH